jgi:hypothetical protein
MEEKDFTLRDGKWVQRTYAQPTPQQQLILNTATNSEGEINPEVLEVFKEIQKTQFIAASKEDAARLQEIYDKNPVFKTLTSILIELQPKCNPKSLFVSHILYGKFVELYKNTIPIRFVRASQKLRAYTGPKIECKLKGKYAQRKWLSIQYGQWFLENKFSQEQRDKWLPTLTGKLDDRHDTLLMCINAIIGISKKQITNKKGKCIK